MDDNRSVFERLDNIEAQNAEIIRLFSASSNIQQPVQQTVVNQPSDQEILQQFLRQSKKSWMWLGKSAEFKKQKNLSIISLLILLIVGIVTTIVSTICFQLYSTFTLFENIWLVFGIIYLTYSANAQRIYEVNELKNHSSISYTKDKLGMMFPRKEKLAFRIFKWLAIISVVCNIICIWAGMGKSNQIIATVLEILFLGAIIFSRIMNVFLFSQYSIIYVEGHNLTTKERVVLVLPPGAKQLMPEEEFRAKMPYFYE